MKRKLHCVFSGEGIRPSEYSRHSLVEYLAPLIHNIAQMHGMGRTSIKGCAFPYGIGNRESLLPRQPYYGKRTLSRRRSNRHNRIIAQNLHSVSPVT